jgi:hypothetical protein
MILPLLLLLQNAPALDVIGRQQLPKTGCAAFLWTISPERRLVAMASGEPAQLRLSLGGKALDLPRAAQQGTAGLGFAAVTEYRGAEATATLELSVETRRDLTKGGTIPTGLLRVARPGQDEVIEPVSGLVGCA